MSYRIAGIDVHKKMLAVVVRDVEVDGEYQFERMRYSSSPEHLRLLAEWLIAQQVEEVAMESTAQYWKPVWGALERYWKPICQERESAGPKSGTLHLAQAQSNRGRRGRKKDFPDAERLVKRFAAAKALGVADDQHEGQCGQGTDSGMRHQSLRLRALLDFLLDRLGQFRDRRIQSIHQLQQIVPSPAGPRSQAK